MFGSSLPHVVCRSAHVLLYFLLKYSDIQHFVLSYVFTFWVPCCDVRYDFFINTMFGSSLYLQLFALWFLRVVEFLMRSVLFIILVFSVVFFVLFVFVLCLVYLMLPVSLDCPFLIVTSVFSNVHFRNYTRWYRQPVNVDEMMSGLY